jgi:hypothetical protein
MSNLDEGKTVPVTEDISDDVDDLNEKAEKTNKHTIRRAVEWVLDLFGLRPSGDVYEELNARYDDASPDPSPDDNDGEAEPA